MTTALTSIETFTAPFNLNEGDVVAIAEAHSDDEHTKVAAVDAITAAGATVISILATNGEASDRGGKTFLHNGGRVEENRQVWEHLGVPPERQIHLGLPDAKLHLPHNRVRLEFALMSAIIRHSITTLITPGETGFDGHSDHIAMHTASLAAIARVGKRDDTPRAVWGLSEDAPDMKLPVDTNRVLGVLALNRSQFKIIPARPDMPTPDGWVKKGDFFLSRKTARLLEPYGTFIDSHEGYRRYI